MSACAAVLAFAGTSHAERPRIAVEHARSDAAARRVLAEVRNAGLDPVDVHAGERSSDVSELADRYRAIAVLSLKHPGRIELAVLSPETREVIYESTVTSKGGTPASVRAAEELHGRLIDLPRREATEAAPADQASAPAPAPEPVREIPVTLQDSPADKPVTFPHPVPMTAARDEANDSQNRRYTHAHLDPSRFWAGASAGASSGVGSGSEVPVFAVEARYEPMRYFSIAAFGILPVAGQQIAAPEGSAELRARIVGGMLRATVVDVGDVFRLTVGGGGGAAIVSMSGHASTARFDARTASAATGVGLATVGMSAKILPWLALRVDALGGLAAYRPVMRFDGRDVATWGPSTMAFTGGLEIDALGFGGGRQ